MTSSKNIDLLKKVLPQAAQLPQTGDFFKDNIDFWKEKHLLHNKSMFWKKFCPRQRSCPGQVTTSNKKSIFCKKFCPRQRSCPGQVARSRESEQPLQPRARSAFSGGPGGGAPWKSRGVRGGAAPPPPVPRIRAKFIVKLPIHRPGGRSVNNFTFRKDSSF